MNNHLKLVLAVLAGVSIGVAGAAATHAQQAKTPPGYVIAEVEVTDPTTLQKYGAKAPQIVASFNGHYVVRGGDVRALEGEPPKGYIVVIGFTGWLTISGIRRVRISGTHNWTVRTTMRRYTRLSNGF
jgi:uncharacterized protein (DUF1330 family)